MPRKPLPSVSRDQAMRLWLERQGLLAPRGSTALSRGALQQHLERTGGLQLDSVNVVDRAHYLTLWSRFGAYQREQVDRWIYRDRIGYEYWGHEASILPISHLPLGRRRMQRFPPASWRRQSWWQRYQTSGASKRRVLRRLREEGPLESIDFERRPHEQGDSAATAWAMPLAKEDKRSLKLLWHGGRVAVRSRRHFRCVYDLAERVYPESEPQSFGALCDSWLEIGLSGNGIASERHLTNYFTAPELSAAERKRVIERNLKKGRIVEVRVEGLPGRMFALPEHLDPLDQPPPSGTTFLSPFDSFLWQRQRAEDLLDFRYRIEIYVPEAKREFGYYVLPILHRGRLVGRLDPKLHRDAGILEIRSLVLEAGVKRDHDLESGVAAALESLRQHVAAERVRLPKGWRGL